MLVVELLNYCNRFESFRITSVYLNLFSEYLHLKQRNGINLNFVIFFYVFKRLSS